MFIAKQCLCDYMIMLFLEQKENYDEIVNDYDSLFLSLCLLTNKSIIGNGIDINDSYVITPFDIIRISM